MRLSLYRLSPKIVVLIFMAVSVVPLYGQDAKTSPDSQAAAQGASEQISEDFKQAVLKSSEPATQSPPDPGQTNTNQTTPPPYVFPTGRERFNRYVKSTVGPFRLVRTAVSAGINQWRDNPEEWEQGASGYGKRFASSFGRNAIQQSVIYGLDSAMGLDTGFKRSTTKGFFPRMKHALAETITSRTRTGKRVISVPRISGAYASAIIAAETWYPDRYSYKDGLRGGTRSLLSGFGINLIQEFLIRF